MVTHRLAGTDAAVCLVWDGWDNLVYEVDDRLVVRLSKEPDPEGRSDLVAREAELLRIVAPLVPVAVPEPVVVDAEAGAIVYPRLDGTLVAEMARVDTAAIADSLAEVIDSLWSVPVARVESVVPREVDQVADWRNDMERLVPTVLDAVDDPSALQRFLDELPPEEGLAAVLCHNDLGADNLLADRRSRLSGVLDWKDAAVTDPALELAPLFRDLGAEVLDRLIIRLGLTEEDHSRAVFFGRCSLVEHLAHARSTGDDGGLRRAVAAFDRVFG